MREQYSEEGYTNKPARSALSFAGGESGMLCHAVSLGGEKAENGLRSPSHVASCGTYRTSMLRTAIGRERRDSEGPRDFIHTFLVAAYGHIELQCHGAVFGYEKSPTLLLKERMAGESNSRQTIC